MVFAAGACAQCQNPPSRARVRTYLTLTYDMVPTLVEPQMIETISKAKEDATVAKSNMLYSIPHMSWRFKSFHATANAHCFCFGVVLLRSSAVIPVWVGTGADL
ncbi:putative transcriptional regulatory protein [Fusarium oxysporum f. sp. albedinis]|nr:putative transcriptional regulatory protein [Fusarium oxysporum f. sp. albedinis]